MYSAQLSLSYKNFIRLMKDYARQIAEQVRAECAEKATCKHIKKEGFQAFCAGVDKDSILPVDIEQFLK